MHTFLFAREVSPEALFPKLCRRVVYLRDKFLADIKAAEKTLVYKSYDLRLDELLHLHDSLKAFGPVRLLHVRLAPSDDEAPWPSGRAGEVVEIHAGLHVGYVGRMGDLDDIPFDEWIGICRTLEHLRTQAAATP